MYTAGLPDTGFIGHRRSPPAARSRAEDRTGIERNHASMSYEHILLEMDGPIARLTLNRPEAANGLHIEMAREFMLAAIECDEDPAVRAVILTGAGKMFCAGGDLKSFATFGDDISARLKEITAYLHAGTSRLARMRAPVIAAVNGMAAGAGFSLAVAADLVLAAESAKFTMAYTGVGLSPDGSSSYFLPRLIGLRKTQELMFTNRRLSAQEALDWGLVNEVVADDALGKRTDELAGSLAAGATESFGMVKKLLISTWTEGFEGQMELEARGIAASAKTLDGKEGIASFLEKRKPEFTGG
jgi:2-(1,2-epoxy-1,2-dihydrophenyl)acetyl-CoA isomerase